MASKTIVASGVAVAVASAFHYEIADAFQAQFRAKDKAVAMVRKHHLTRPTFEQYKADLAALKAVAEEKGRDYVWLRRCYSAALVEIFDELPVSTDAAAVEKRKQREAKKAQQKQVLIDTGLTQKPKNWTDVEVPATASKGKKGAPKDQKKDQVVPYGESIEQVVSRYDTYELLDAIARVLSEEKETELEAAGLATIARKLRTALKKDAPKKEPKPRATQNNVKQAAAQ